MNIIKKFVSAILVFSMIIGYSVISMAVSAEECSYSSAFDGRQYAPPVEDAKIEDSCLYYSILSTAGSYAKKYYDASDKEADFNEDCLAEAAGNPDIHNFGDILYKSVGCDIGNNYTITSVEFLNGRGERYLKEKISENGAIVAAFAVPKENGLNNQKYFNSEENSFAYVTTDAASDKYHAVSIVGWDDNYDRAKYNKDESGKSLGRKNGAWICKNSDTKFGDDGYFYLSYNTPFIHAASLEVSKVRSISLTLKPEQILNNIGFIYGVNVRAYSASTEKITVMVGNKIAFSGELKLKNGCNLVLFEHPVLSGKVSVTGDNISTASDTFYCYWSLVKMKNIMTVKPAAIDENWQEDVQNIWISVEAGNSYCLTKNPVINHIVRKDSTNNCYYIIPADGYSFTEDTVIKNIDGFNNTELSKLYGNDVYKDFKKNSTINEAVNADYKRLKDDDGNFIKMIEFDPEWDGGRGRLKIVGQNIGSAFAEELNILTDESGKIKNTILTFDDGSTLTVPAEISIYKDESRTESINDINGLEEYFSEIKISGYYSNDLTVKINGVKTDCEINTDNTEITVNVKISVPDVTDTINETFRVLREIFAKLIEKSRFKRR